MTSHHLTLEHVARALHQLLSSSRLTAAWSQEKHVAAFVFEGGSRERSIVIDVSSDGACISERTSLRRAHRNSRDIFPELVGQNLAVVAKQQDDRVISFVFDRHVMHVELFSAGKGNIVLTLDGCIVDALHNRLERLESDYLIVPREMHEPLSTNDSTVASDLASSRLRMGRHYAEEVCHRCGIDTQAIVGTLTSQHRNNLLQGAEDLIGQCRFEPRFLLLARGDERLFSLSPLQGWTVHEESDDVLEAVRRASVLRHAHRAFVNERRSRLRVLDAQITRTERTLQAVEADAKAPERPALYRSWADTIMSQPNLQRQGLECLESMNVSSLTSDLIPLRADRSLLDNATAYYHKARNAEIAARTREKRLPALQHQLDTLREQRTKLLEAASLSDLSKPSRPMTDDSRATTSAAAGKFRVFQIDADHTLYVGRSAANNDELTMKFARQNDWWMHVRGASGSHAVLRGVSGPKIPKQILEAAAAITAYYSQARNASYVPVVYTQRKFVRKPKGANVGAVTLEREQSVMVRPGLPAGSVSDE